MHITGKMGLCKKIRNNEENIPYDNSADEQSTDESKPVLDEYNPEENYEPEVYAPPQYFKFK